MKTYDLIVLGAGSGNSLLGPELAHLRTAIVEPDRFGGTCLNRGCIPSKMLVVAADAARAVTEARRLGVHATLDLLDWPAIRDRIFGRIDPLHDDAIDYRRKNGIDVYPGSARFVAPKVLEVDGEQLTADQIVVAVGARPVVPPIPGLDGVPFHTSDTMMRIDEVPRSLVIIGGGFIAAELGHVFASFGAEVTIIARSPRLLMAEDEQISIRFTELAQERFRVLLDSAATSVAARDGGVTVSVERDRQASQIEGAALLVATGRIPNTDLIDAATGGLALDEHGHVVTDHAYRSTVSGVWALGDTANHFQLKHMANAEQRVVSHNLAHPESLRQLNHRVLVPHAVFSDPQIASVGLTEAQAQEQGLAHVVACRDYAATAYGWALEDTTSFVKILVDPRARTLLGAHIIGPQAALLLQPLLQAMMLGQTVDQLARDVLYIHPALTEVLEQALLEVSS
ncbi:mycothione reductase [Sporichthya sp.]|uniref:mycothione reductase n=1 Tax=Sporichthya sp. TaxID=65475 RepID=UPI00182F089E|nr:mycothione reductase [Sporichthya sp.]MBA3743220.1 mycothione reductase [Sporichthya sp.]